VAIAGGHKLSKLGKHELHEKNHGGLDAFTAELVQCLMFLTRLPLPADFLNNLPPLNQAMRQFPLIGALIGGMTGLLSYIGLSLGLSSPIAATLAIAATVVLTGGLHEDGLADMADGFGGGKDAGQKLAIMRDSRIGTYGVLALVFAILLKVQAISILATQPAWLLVATLATLGALSRALMVWLMRTSLPARSDGLGATAGQPSQATMIYALSLGIALAAVIFWIASDWLAAILVPAIGLAVAALIRSLAARQIGGFTGDVCGAVQVLSETAMLIAASSTLL
jgi:adenosylcobinamide-GDP ribazoletransferase